MIKTKSLYKPKESDDGTRILISRLYPRGIKKSSFDEWFKELSPSLDLIHEYKNNEISWKKFLSSYKSEISKNPKSLDLIKQIRKKNKSEDITFLCFESDGEPCHRHVLREIVKKSSFLTTSAIPKFVDV
jgi:uncharacterized protein YeaO (DUF488 family)